MAFWDKVTEVTKSVTEKTNDMIEIGKLNSKISAAEKEIDEKVLKIGDFYLNAFDAGTEPAEELKVVYEEIAAVRNNIAEYKAQLAELKAPKEEPAAPAAEAQAPAGESATVPAGAFCISCGAALVEDAKFCASCGAKVGE